MRELARRPLLLGSLVTLAAWLLFLLRLAVPHQPVFDETHYVPAARALLALSGPTNIEHPLLAKELIAAGIALFGDNSFGWRFFSTIAGAATIASVFAILHLLYGRLRTTLVGTALALLNFTIYVQARIAMLDTYMAAFLLAGIALLLWAMRRGGWGTWLAGGMMLGLAVASKWLAAPLVAFACVGFLWAKHADPRRWPGLPAIPAVLALGTVSIATYFVTFAPAFFYASDPLTLARLIPFQQEMYARQTQVLPPHTYQSQYWTWPLLIRPIWYLYEPADGAQRGILLIGNPAIMWGGLVAVAACLWAWAKTGTARMLAPAALWLGSYAIWALIPKSLGFYYYYYLPSIFLPLCLAAAFDHWRDRLNHWDESFLALALGCAIYFAPILAAFPLAGPASFQRWTFFSSWV